MSLCFTSDPLEQDLSLLGNAHAVLHVASSATVMGFCVSISDVGPDGLSHLVAKGMLNGTRRRSFCEPEAIVPGEAMELDIQMHGAGWTCPRGNRIRGPVAKRDWPD